MMERSIAPYLLRRMFFNITRELRMHRFAGIIFRKTERQECNADIIGANSSKMYLVGYNICSHALNKIQQYRIVKSRAALPK